MRISDSLKILKSHLENYDELNGKVKIENLINPNNSPAVLDGVILTFLGINEEFTLKNGKQHKITQSYKVSFENRPVYTNYILIVSCHDDTYDTALVNLSRVIEFFQAKNVFSHLDGLPDAMTLDEKFKLIVDLQNPSYEQVNYIWSLYGGMHKPSVYYRVRMIPHKAKDKKRGVGEPILQVNLDGNTTF